MTRSQRRGAAALTLLCAIYVLAFAPANRTGAANANMLEIFELDEFAQFRALWQMTKPRATAGEALYGVFAYDYYYYGFPFFAVSAAVFWPLRMVYMASGEPGLTAASVLALRQLSPLFTAIAIAILVILWTRLESLPRVVGLFAFLAAIPAVVSNNLWWHPDALLLLCVVLVIAALSLDRLRLGRWFYAAAFACGLTIATKMTGWWFFAAVAVHLIRARHSHRVPALLRAALGFVAAMALVIAAASPQLFLPDEWDEIAAAMATWLEASDVGWETKGRTGPAAWYPTLTSGFGWACTWIVLAALALGTALRARRTEHRDLAIAILAWVIPLTGYLLTGVALQFERYLLPVLVPLASCAGSAVLWDPLRENTGPVFRRAAAASAILLLTVQLGFNTLEARERYSKVLHREETSPSLTFWRLLDREVISQLPGDTPLRILKSLYIYNPPDPRLETHIRWRSLEYADLEASDPDLVLLQQSHIQQLTSPSLFDSTTDPDGARRSQPLYRDARDDAIPGYRRLLATDFAVAYGRTLPRGPVAGASPPDSLHPPGT